MISSQDTLHCQLYFTFVQNLDNRLVTLEQMMLLLTLKILISIIKKTHSTAVMYLAQTSLVSTQIVTFFQIFLSHVELVPRHTLDYKSHLWFKFITLMESNQNTYFLVLYLSSTIYINAKWNSTLQHLYLWSKHWRCHWKTVTDRHSSFIDTDFDDYSVILSTSTFMMRTEYLQGIVFIYE